jgi:hypothetical protein
MDAMKWIRLQWDRVGAWVCVGLGAIVLIVGWIGISNKVYTAEQMPYMLSGGVGGVFLLGLGAVLWLSADMRDEWHKLDQIEKVLGSHAPPAYADPRYDTNPEGAPVYAGAPQAHLGAPDGPHDYAAAGNGSSWPPEGVAVPAQPEVESYEEAASVRAASRRQNRPLSAAPASRSRRRSGVVTDVVDPPRRRNVASEDGE